MEKTIDEIADEIIATENLLFSLRRTLGSMMDAEDEALVKQQVRNRGIRQKAGIAR